MMKYSKLLYFLLFLACNIVQAQEITLHTEAYKHQYQGGGTSHGLYGNNYLALSDEDQMKVQRLFFEEANFQFLQNYFGEYPSSNSEKYDNFINYVKQAKQVNPNLKISIVMDNFPKELELQTGEDTKQIPLNTEDPEIYDKVGQWYFDVLQYFHDNGVKIDFMNLVNEPDFKHAHRADYYGVAKADFGPDYNKEGVALIAEHAVNKLKELLADGNVNVDGIEKPLIIAPSALGIGGCKGYISYMKDKRPNAWANIDIVGTHQYSPNSANPNTFDQIAAIREHRPLIQTEQHTNKGDDIGYPSITSEHRGVLSLGQVFSAAVNGGAIAWWYFQTNYPNAYHNGGLIQVSKGTIINPYQQYYAMKQLNATQPTGSHVIEYTKQNVDGVYSLAFRKKGTNKAILHLTNKKGEAKGFNLILKDGSSKIMGIKSLKVWKTDDKSEAELISSEDFDKAVKEYQINVPRYSLTSVEVTFDPTGYEDEVLTQNLTFDKITDKVITDAPFNISAKSSAKLPISYKVISGNATLQGSYLTITGLGKVIVEASQEGNDQFLAATPKIQEFYVFPTDPNIAVGKTATASSYNDKTTYPASNAFDGDRSNSSSRWLAKGGSSNPQWIEVDLGESHLINGFSYWTGDATYEAIIKDFELQSFENGNWVNKYVAEDRFEGDAIIAVEEFVGTKIRFNINDDSNSKIELFELELYGKKGSKQEQTIDFSEITDQLIANGSFELNATSTSGLPVTYSIVEGAATIEGNTVTLKGIGKVTIEASQSGDDTYQAEKVTQSFYVIPAENIAKGKTAKASTTYSSKYTPDKAIDGDKKTDNSRWLSGKNDKLPQSIEVDLGEEHVIKGVGFWIGSNGYNKEFTDFELQSFEGGQWVTKVTVTGNDSPEKVMTFDAFTASQVRLYVTAGKSSVIRLYELELYGGKGIDPKNVQSINFPTIADRKITENTIELTATTTAGLPVSYDVVEGNASLSGSTLTVNGLGKVTVKATQAGTANISAAEEVQQTFYVFPAENNVALGRTASASSVYENGTVYTAAKAFDSDRTSEDSRWLALKGGSLPQSIEVDLGSRYEISALGLWTGSNGYNEEITDFELQSFEEGAWVTKATFTGNTRSDLITTVTPFNATKVRLSITGGKSATVNLYELELFGIENSDEKLEQTITFGTIGDAKVGNSFELTASSSMKLPITYEVIEGNATVSGSTITINGIGKVTVKATQPGDDTFEPAPEVTQSFYALPIEDNIALNKTYAASSLNQSKYSADKAFDGDRTDDNSRWLSKNTNFPHWIEVDLGTKHTIKAIGFWNGGSNKYEKEFTSYELQSFENGAWVTKFAVTDNDAADKVIPVNEFVSNKVRLHFLAGKSKIIRLYEWAIYGEETPDAKSDQTITFDAIADMKISTSPYELKATSSSKLDVSYEVTEGDATVNGTSLTINSIGKVTVKATQAGDNDFNAADEVSQTFYALPTEDNIALGKTYAASSINLSKYSADKAFDGNRKGDDSRWLSKNADFPHWIEVDLGKDHIIKAIGFWNGGSGKYEKEFTSYELQSFEGGTWVTKFAVTDNDAPDKVIPVGEFTANKVRLHLLAGHSKIVRLFELALYGEEAPNGKSDQAITFDAIADMKISASPYELKATSDSKLAVSYEVTEGDATVNGTSLTINGIGKVTVKATQAGDANFNAADEVSQTFYALPAEDNIALGKTYMASTEYDATFTAAKAFDGDRSKNSSRWLSGKNDKLPQSIEIDLATKHTVKAIGFWTGGDGKYEKEFSSYQIQSYEGNQWVTKFAVTDNTSPDQVIAINEFVATKVRLNVLNGASSIVRLYELAIYGEETPNAKFDQTITFGEIADMKIDAGPYELKATSNSNLDVSYEVTEGDATVNGTSLTINSIGKVTVKATQAGDNDFNAADEVSQTFYALPVEDNIALGKTYAASSINLSKYSADKAFDGNRKGDDSRWLSKNADFPHWIEVDLGKDHIIKAIGFWNGGSGKYEKEFTSYELQSFENGAWVTKVAVTDNDAPDKVIPVGEFTANKVRLHLLAGNSKIVRLFELALYGEEAPNGKSDQAITFDAIADMKISASPYELKATSDSKLAVSYEVTEGDATVNGTSLTINGIGKVTVKATQAGDANFNAADEVSQTFYALPAEDNIALGKTYMASTEYDATFTAAKAFDGDRSKNSSRWLSGKNDKLPQSIEIDLATKHTVKAIGFWTGGDGKYEKEFSSYQIQSYEGNQWVTKFAVTDNTSPDQVIAINEFVATKVRLNVLNGASSIVRLYELAIYGEETPNAKFDQTITFGEIADMKIDAGPYELKATSNSNLDVSYEVTEGDATVNGTSLTINSIGKVTVKATQAGDNDFNAADEVSQTFYALPAEENIALGKTYAASSINLSKYSADKAFDGNRKGDDSRWLSKNADFPHWIEVDLGKDYLIKAIGFWNGGSGKYEKEFTSYELQSFENGAWVTKVAVTDNDAPDKVIPVGEFTANKVRLHLLAGKSKIVRLFELALYGEEAPEAKKDQTITFDAIADMKISASPYELKATSDSKLAVSYEVTEGDATVNGTSLTINGIGKVTVKATQAGDNDFDAADEVSQSFYVLPNEENIALNKAATASSWESKAGNAFDGNRTENKSRWVSEKSDYPHWIEVDLKTRHKINAIGFWVGNKGYNNEFTSFELQSFEGGEWKTKVEVKDNTSPDRVMPVNEFMATKVRLHILSGSDNIVRLFELALYGTEAPDNRVEQTISFESITDKKVNDGSFDLVATSDSKLPVSFEVTEGNATISGNKLTIEGIGKVTVKATQAGDNSYLPAEFVNQSFYVFPTEENVALNKTATASSSKSTANKAFDGDRTSKGSRWVSDKNLPHWIEVDLESRHKISSIGFWVGNGENDIYNNEFTSFELQSYEAGKWVTKVTVDNNTSPDRIMQVDEFLATKVRLYITGGTSSIIRLFELELYGEEAPDERKEQTITFSEIADPKISAGTVDISAESTSGLPLTLKVVEGNAEISGNTVTLKELGKVTVQAIQEGDQDYKSTDASYSFYVTPEEENVALGKPATASSTTNGSSANNAFDGDRKDSRWVSVIENAKLPQWIEVDLKAECSIKGLGFWNGNKGYNQEFTSFELQSYENGTWVTKVKVEDNTLPDRVMEVEAFTATKVRLHILKGKSSIVRLYELALYGTIINDYRKPQNIKFEDMYDVSIAESTVDISAQATSKLPVTFEITEGSATISGNTINLNGIGKVTVKATQQGNGNFLPTTNSKSFYILPAEKNIATDKKYSSSSKYGSSLSASKAFDGNRIYDESRWVSAKDGILPQWIEVDLGTEHIIKGMAFWTGNNAEKDGYSQGFTSFELQSFENGAWVTKVKVQDNTSSDRVMYVNEFNATKVRLHILEGVSPVRLYELALYGVNIPDERNEQEITFAAIPDTKISEGSIELNAEATSKLPVTFEVVEGKATISGNKLQLNGLGKVEVKVIQEGNNEYKPATAVSHSFYVKPEKDNVALGKTAKASSIYQAGTNYTASKAFDGDRTTETSRWLAEQNGTLPQWIEVDLGTEHIIDAIGFWVGKDGYNKEFTSFEIQSFENEEWVTKAKVKDNASSDRIMTVNEFTATKVRLHILEGKSTLVNLYELELYGEEKPDLRKEQTINFAALSDKKISEGSILLKATSTSGLPVTLELVEGDATLSNNTLTFNGLGKITVKATQEGNDGYFAAEAVSQSFYVIPAEENVAIGKAATASSLFEDGTSYTADKAIDGNRTSEESRWISAKEGDLPQWIEVDLGVRHTIKAIGFWSGNNGYNQAIKSFDLQSFEKGEWVNKIKVVNNASSDRVMAVNEFNATKVRLKINDGEAASVALYELALYGVENIFIPEEQSITFFDIADKKITDGTVQIIANSTSGLPVKFEIVEGSATLTDNKVTLNGLGKVTVKATQEGNDEYNAAKAVTKSFYVFPKEENIAFGKTATASSVFEDGSVYSANKAFDGNRKSDDSRWLAQKDGSLPQWIEVDLGTAHTIKAFSFWTGTNGYNNEFTSFELQSFENGAWVTKVKEENNASPDKIMLVDEFTATKVRLNILAGKSSVVNLYELELYGSENAIVPESQVITFGEISDININENTFVLSATATSGLPVSFEIVEGDASINDGVLTANRIGKVSVKATQNGNNNYKAAKEVTQQFYVFPSEENVALGKTAAASSELNDGLVYSASKAFDGNITAENSRWMAQQDSKLPQWIEVDLAGNFTINSIGFWTGSKGYNQTMTSFELQSFENGKWVTKVSIDNNAFSDQLMEVNAFSASKVRLNILAADASPIGLYELALYGTENKPTSIQNPNTAEQILLYPNPVQEGPAWVKNLKPSDKVSVYSITGKKEQISVMGNQLDLSALKAGMYILKVNEKSIRFMKK